MGQHHDDSIAIACFLAPDGALVAEVDLTGRGVTSTRQAVRRARALGAEKLWVQGEVVDDAARFVRRGFYARLEAPVPPAPVELARPPAGLVRSIQRACYADVWGRHEGDVPAADAIFVGLHERGRWVGICEVDPESRWIDGPGVVPPLRTPDRYARLVRGAAAHLPAAPVLLESWDDSPQTLETYVALGFEIVRLVPGWELDLRAPGWVGTSADEWDALPIDDTAHRRGTRRLRELGDVIDALERLPVPVYVIDRTGVIRWLNRASHEFIGEREGARFVDVLEPESVPVAREAFAKKLVGGAPSTEFGVTIRTRDGRRVRAEVSSVALRDDHSVAGVFGIADPVGDEAPPAKADGPLLTPRQAQVLRLLAGGRSTEQMAEELGVAPDTIRNHVRGIFRRLGVHSRLEAVIEAHARGLV
ncbi:MAG TPA: LuxR C-terminal-related transcriptional regulator [Gaiellaceae bacterium]|nr:LuxR C-terminal-related transcriptional regulator [Gaiellaceae bacterium]